MTGWCQFALKAVGSRRKTGNQIVVTWSTKVQLKSVEIEDGPILTKGSKSEQAWEIGITHRGSGEVTNADGSVVETAKGNR